MLRALGITTDHKANAFNALKLDSSHRDADTFFVDAYEKGKLTPDMKDEDGTPFLILALKNRHKISAEYLLSKGANPNAVGKDGEPALLIAATQIPELIEPLIAKGADPKVVDAGRNTALLRFIKGGRAQELAVNIVNLLLRKGVDVNATNNYKFTALHSAIYNRYSQIIIPLLDAGASLTIKDRHGRTPLMLAFISSLPKYVDILLNYEGSDPNELLPDTGLPLLASAIQMNDSDMFDMLVHVSQEFSKINDEVFPGFIDFQMSDGKTALHIAAELDAVPYAIKLIAAGAKTDIRDKSGKLAKEYAKSSEMKEVMGAEEEKYKGYSKSDAELFNAMFEEPNEWSCCPVCLAYVRRSEGCMYMKHQCDKDNRHEELFRRYKDTRYKVLGEIEWCTICGRIAYMHKHYQYAPPSQTKLPEFAPLAPDVDEGPARHFDSDCKKVGGGGFEEKVRRIHRLLGYACELQEEVGKLSAKKARDELIEEVWKAGDARNRAVPKMIANKKFDFPCTFPEDVKVDAAPSPEKDYPDILRPADEAGLTPIKHEAPDNTCAIDLGPHDDGRPVYQFQHKQPDGSVYKHKSYICAEDLEQLIRSQPIDGKCRIEPDKCKALLYPSELKEIVTPEFYETYRKLFNKAQAKEGGKRPKNRTKKRFRFRGAAKVPSLMKPVDMDTAECAPPQKAGKRRTFKKKHRKSHTRRRRV